MPMVSVSAQLRSIPGTEAAAGWAGAHTIVVDRPEGRAGGMGLGFNGGQLLALSIGGCLCNDIHYAAHAMNLTVDSLSVDVELLLDGEPLLAVAANVKVAITSSASKADREALMRRAEEISTISNSLRRGIAVKIDATEA